MKILHTADWHVGKSLAGRSRAAEHEEVLAEIVQIARTEDVHLVIVAGDLFDTTSPSAEAERIVFGALMDLGAHAPVVVVPGNHDNERRLAALRPLLELAGVTVHPFIGQDCLEIEAGDGGRAKVALIPWLSQRYIVKADELMKNDADELTGQFAERMRRLVGRITEGFSPDAVNLVVGHLTIAGGELGGGERTAQTIFDYWVDPTIFPATTHYAALGHLHKMQKMPGPCPIYYSGSPLQLDFGEAEAQRHVLLVEATPGVPAVVRPVELSSGRRLRTIAGTLEDLRAVAGSGGEEYLRVYVKEMTRVGLGDEVRELFPNAVKVIVDAPTDHDEPKPSQTREALSPHDLFAAYLGERNISDERLLTLFDQLYEEAHATASA